MKKVHDPIVSVIVSFFNEEKFLSETVESVLSQSYTNWELILVDDGSVDGSTLIARNFATANPGKIIYVEHDGHQNKGVCVSRNKGISVSNGELIALLDADDVWLEDKLKLQVEIMQNNPEVGMLCEASKYWYSWEDETKEDEIIRVGSIQDKKFKPGELLGVLYPLSSGAAPCPSGIVLRRDAFIKSGGFEDQFTGKYQLYEDQAFLAKIYLRESVFVSSLCNNKYRQREGSCVQRVNQEGNYHVVRKYFLDWLREYLKENDLETTQLSALLDTAFKPYRNIKKTNPLKLLVTGLKKFVL